MKTGFKISAWIAGFIVWLFILSKCFRLVSAPNDFMVVCGIVGILLLLAVTIGIILRVGKSIIKKLTKWEEA
jgi:hypothetical protein